jgi:hypothetical protein
MSDWVLLRDTMIMLMLKFFFLWTWFFILALWFLLHFIIPPMSFTFMYLIFYFCLFNTTKEYIVMSEAQRKWKIGGKVWVGECNLSVMWVVCMGGVQSFSDKVWPADDAPSDRRGWLGWSLGLAYVSCGLMTASLPVPVMVMMMRVHDRFGRERREKSFNFISGSIKQKKPT